MGFKAFCLLLGAALLTGCFYKTDYDDIIGGIVDCLDRGQGVYVTTPDDDGYQYVLYEGSGVMTGNFLAEALRLYCSQVRLGPQGQPLSEAFAAAAQAGARYLFVPQLLEWAPPAMAYSHTPVRFMMTVTVYDVVHKHLLLQKDVTIVNCGITLVTRSLPDLVRESVTGLCRVLFCSERGGKDSPPA